MCGHLCEPAAPRATAQAPEPLGLPPAPAFPDPPAADSEPPQAPCDGPDGAPVSPARAPRGAFEELSMTIVGPWGPTSCRYLQSVPAAARCGQGGWPVLLFLTGHGEIRKADKVQAWIESDRGIDAFALQHFAVVVPLVTWDSALCEGHSVDVEALWLLLRVAVSRLGHLVDDRRVCVTGFSMGADAAALLAARRGGQLAAVALFSGSYERLVREPPAQAAEQLSDVSLRAFHAVSDTYVPPQHTRNMFEWLCGQLGGERWSRLAAFDDPEPPYWDRDAKVDFEVWECNQSGVEKTVWLMQDYVWRRAGDEYDGWCKRRSHVCWPTVYLNEGTFGLFRWLLQHQSREGLLQGAASDIALRRALRGPGSSSRQLGFHSLLQDLQLRELLMSCLEPPSSSTSTSTSTSDERCWASGASALASAAFELRWLLRGPFGRPGRSGSQPEREATGDAGPAEPDVGEGPCPEAAAAAAAGERTLALRAPLGGAAAACSVPA